MIGVSASATNRGIARIQQANAAATLRKLELCREIERQEVERQERAASERVAPVNAHREKAAAPAVPTPQPKPSTKPIIAEVCTRHGVTRAEVVGRSRTRHIVAARQECFFRIHEEMDLSLPQIGRIFGGRDHTTVLYGIRRHRARIEGGEVVE